MPKKVEQCVKRLLDNPDFKAFKGKTREESAWAVCQSKYKKEDMECVVCEIDNDVLFKEALESLVKELSIEGEKHEQDYLLEGIQFSQFKETISTEDLEKINKFAIKAVEAKEVTVFTALLIDDKITRNNTVYNKDFQSMLLSLPPGEGNFIGAPILFGEGGDHQHAASAQVGRIFDAWQVVSEDKHFGVMAKIYVLNEGNEDLITKINSGVLKEMSIATKVELPLCSTCGQDIRACDHTPGQEGCHVIMSGRGFVAEASFVAVPGSNSAKILSEDETKRFLRLENLQEVVGPMILESLNSIAPSGIAHKEDIDEMEATASGILSKIEEINGKFETFNLRVEEFSKHLQLENETVMYKIDVVSVLNDLKDRLEAGKEFTIKNLAKYRLTPVNYKTDSVPDIVQGLRGEDVGLIVRLYYDNTEILEANIVTLETFLKVTPEGSKMIYEGDINNVNAVLRFLSKKHESLNVRILQLKGQFNLQELERQNIIEEATKYGIICGKFGFNDKTLAAKFFEAMTTEEIKEIKEKFFAEGSKFFTPEIIKQEEEEAKAKEEASNKNEAKPASLREIAKKIVNGGK